MSIKRGVLLLVLCLVALAIAWQSQQVRPLMQYGFQVRLAREEPAGDAQAGAGEEGGQAVAEKDKAGTLPAFLKRFDEFVLEQGDSLVSAALTAHLPAATLSTEQGGSASAELTTVYGALHTLVPGVLLSGRLLYQEEVDAGAKVAVLDEGLAIALFRQGDPVVAGEQRQASGVEAALACLPADDEHAPVAGDLVAEIQAVLAHSRD